MYHREFTVGASQGETVQRYTTCWPWNEKHTDPTVSVWCVDMTVLENMAGMANAVHSKDIKFWMLLLMNILSQM